MGKDYLLRNIPDEIRRQVKAAAALQDISVRQFMLNALKRELERFEKKKKS